MRISTFKHAISLATLAWGACIIAVSLGSSTVLATTDACWFDSDTLKLEKTLVVPLDRQADFIAYLRNELSDGGLSRSEVESDRSLRLIYQNVEAGILAITIQYSKTKHTFSATVESCDFKRDWRPYWRYLEKRVEAFDRAVQIT